MGPQQNAMGAAQETLPAPNWSSKSAADKVLEVFELQEFDGSWTAGNAQIPAIPGFAISSKPNPKVWGHTAGNLLSRAQEQWRGGTWGMVEKARDWLAANVSTGLEDLEKEAARVVKVVMNN